MSEKLFKEKSDIIVSNRTFGIEIEADARNGENIDELSHSSVGNWINMRNDSSIRGDRPIELVTPVLQGESGAKRVIDLCKTIKGLDFDTDNRTCGMHLHLDGKEFLPKETVIVVDDNTNSVSSFLENRADDIITAYYVPELIVEKYRGSNTVRDFINFANSVKQRMKSGLNEISGWKGFPLFSQDSVRSFNNSKPITVYSLSEINPYDQQIADLHRQKESEQIRFARNKESKNVSDPEKLREIKLKYKEKEDEANSKYVHRISKMFKSTDGKYVFKLFDDRPLNRVKSLMAFYIGFNDVVQGMVAPSRKIGNAYCMPISDFFDLKQVGNLKKYSDFEALWYKDGNPSRIEAYKSQHYNDSRYLDINLHSLFNRTNTVEIRLHGSTKDENVVLLWTAFHQHIIDRIASDELTFEDIVSVVDGTVSTSERYHAMVQLLELPEHLAAYVKRLITHFTNEII